MKAEAKSKQMLKNVLIIALGIVILSLGVRLTMTAFTANSFLKAVNATDKTENLFTSDLLAGYANAPDDTRLDTDHISKALSSTGDTVSFDFNIYNYLLNDTTMVNTKDVFYTLTIKAVPVTSRSGSTANNGDSSAPYTISLQGSDSRSFAMNGTASIGELILAGNAANSHHFTVTLPTSEIGNVAFVVKAEVREGSSLNCLAAKVVTTEASQVNSYSLSKELIMTGSPRDNAAYNCRITVTGEGKQVKLTWPDSVELEPFFDTKFKLTANDGTPTRDGNSATFYLAPGTHTINFYQKSGAEQIPEDKATFEQQFSVSVVSSN